jgi:hypothetical protein
MGKRDLEVRVTRDSNGDQIGAVTRIHADPDDTAVMEAVLLSIITGQRWDARRAREFTLRVRNAGDAGWPSAGLKAGGDL